MERVITVEGHAIALDWIYEITPVEYKYNKIMFIIKFINQKERVIEYELYLEVIRDNPTLLHYDLIDKANEIKALRMAQMERLRKQVVFKWSNRQKVLHNYKLDKTWEPRK